jgi:hypothetical protein
MYTRLLSAPAIALFLAIFSLAPASSEASARPPRDAAAVQADEYFRQGKALVKQGRLEDAYRAYLAGYQLRQGYDLAGNLGNVELELGKPRDAAEHLAFCLKIFPATGTAKQLEFIKGRLAEARGKVGALSIKVSESLAEVTIDGRAIGRPPFSDEVFVDPGTHTVEARLRGYKPARKVIQIEKGASAKVDLELTPIAAPDPPPQGVIPREPKASVHPGGPVHKRSPLPVILGASAAAVGAAVGIAGAVASSSASKSADAQHAALELAGGKSACSHMQNQASCDALDRTYLRKATYRTVSVLGFSASGAALAATLVIALLPGEKPKEGTIQASVVVAPGGAGIGIKGRF